MEKGLETALCRMRPTCQLILSDPRKGNKKLQWEAHQVSSHFLLSHLLGPTKSQKSSSSLLAAKSSQVELLIGPVQWRYCAPLNSLWPTFTICQMGVKGCDWQKGRHNNYIRTSEMLRALLAKETETQLRQRLSGLSAVSWVEEITTVPLDSDSLVWMLYNICMSVLKFRRGE